VANLKIAVVGGGISGLGTALILSREHEVHLFESDKRLGGHAHTVEVQEDGAAIPMDTGFLVFNELNYPHLTAFFRHLNVDTVDSDMSLSVRVASIGLEWCGTNLNTVFGQRKNLLRPSFYRMLRETLRFHREASDNLGLARRHAWTLGDLLRERSYTKEFSAHYLLPIGAAIWSTPERGMLEYPAETFLSFFLNHKLLQVNDRPVWKTVKGGSVCYVNKVKALLPFVHSGHKVLSVKRNNLGVLVRTTAAEGRFDRVVLATHAPVSLSLLADPTEAESKVLGAFQVLPNQGVLHRDARAMPETRRCWSAWNVTAQGREDRVSLTYHLNRLQPLQSKKQYFLSLNPPTPFSDQLGEFSYDHPHFTTDAIRAQREIPNIQGIGGVYFAGAWTRYGFHEDGLLSAVKVAELMRCPLPWRVSA